MDIHEFRPSMMVLLSTLASDVDGVTPLMVTKSIEIFTVDITKTYLVAATKAFVWINLWSL